MSDIVKLEIKISGSDSFKEVEVSAKDLAEAIDKVKKHTHDLNEKLLNANQLTQAFDQVTSAVQSIHSAMRDLTDTYAVQAAAEARLEQMMHNTMDATDEEIQSIKDLAAEQQKLGVIGDEVILSGAQELATYMQKKESLEALIPVMSDMIAQQYEYNATTSGAVAVAQMMGKVFAGEVGSLKRLGYSFDEAQEQILKFGTEEEKVAVLTEVVGDIVDGTNAKLAAMPYGVIVKMRMAIGDLKEDIGEMVAPAMGAVESLANITIALSGIAKGSVYIGKCIAALTAFAQSSKMAATRTAVLGVHSKVTAMAQNMLAAAGIKAAAGTTALRLATTALYAAMSLGLTIVIQGVITLISRLTNKTREAADGMDALKEANEAYKSAVASAKAEIDTEVAALKNLIGSGKDTAEAIQRLNEKYGEAFGYHQTAAEWYDTLVGKSQIYCRQLGYEAKAKSLSASIGAKIVERDELKESLPQGDWKWDAEAKKYRDYSMNLTFRYADKDTHKKLAQIANLEKQITEDTKKMDAAWGEAAKAVNELKPQNTAPDPILTQVQFDLVKKHKEDLTKKQREMIDKGYADLTEDEQRVLKKRYDAISKSENRELDKQYDAAIKVTEVVQRKKENALKEQYAIDHDADAYARGMEQTAIEGLEVQRDVAKKYGKDTTKIEQQLADARIEQRENEFDRRQTQLGDCLADEKLSLSIGLAEQETDQKEHDKLVLEVEERNLEERLELYREFGKDATAVMQQLFDKRKEIAEGNYDDEAAALQKNLDDTEISLKTSLANQAISQDQYDRDMLAARARFYDDMLKLTRAYGKNDTQAMKDVLDAQLSLQNFDNRQEESKGSQGTAFGNFTKGWSGLKGIGNSIRDIKDALTETDNAWDALTQTVDGFIGLFQSIQAVVGIIKAVTATTETMTAVEETANTARIATNASLSTSNTAVAATAAAAAVAGIPVIGPEMALTWAATIESALSAIPKLAKGGIVYGPTLGIMGEYGGASSNPEVIAPLSRLRTLIGADGGTGRSEVKFRIQGRELVGIMNKQNNIYRRSQ